jgi:hypothetical protein
MISHWDTSLQKGVSEGDVRQFPNFVTSISIDTLNKESIISKDLSGIEILSINGLPYDESAYTEQDKWAKISQTFWFNYNYLKKDTLYINFGMPFSEESVHLEIIGTSILGTYRERYKYDKILKQHPNDTLTNDLTLHINFDKILLNTTTFEEGTLIFGYTVISVPPYYISESRGLEGPLYLQKKYEMYFKVEIAH